MQLHSREFSDALILLGYVGLGLCLFGAYGCPLFR